MTKSTEMSRPVTATARPVRRPVTAVRRPHTPLADLDPRKPRVTFDSSL